MLCYRFLMSQKMSSSSSSYLKLYDAEIVPLLLRRPAQATHLQYSTLQCTSALAAANSSNRVHRQEQDFIRSTRHLFHTNSIHLKDKPNAAAATTTEQPPAVEDAKPVQSNETTIPLIDPETEKLGLFARFKKMYKEYWYVLLPVHVVTSAGWLGGFYYLSKSGFDVASLMESWHFNELIVSHLRDSKLGHVAIGYFLYKCFTPIRYMVTLGSSTWAIKYMSKLGYIRPVPSKNALMKMYQDKKDSAKMAIHKKTHGDSNNI